MDLIKITHGTHTDWIIKDFHLIKGTVNIQPISNVLKSASLLLRVRECKNVFTRHQKENFQSLLDTARNRDGGEI